MEPKKRFTVTTDAQQHLVTVRLWGRWDIPMTEAFRQEIRRQAHTLATGGHNWYLLLDVTNQIPPTPDIVRMIQDGLNALHRVHIPRQAIVVRSMIPHFSAQARARPDPPIISYFQAQEEALRWLLEK
jgi:hypothetical protein